MTKKCKDCKCFVINQNINNCKAGMFVKVDPNDSSCYKIQYNNKSNDDNT